MKNILIGVVGAVAVIALSVYVGMRWERSRIVQKVVTTEARLNIDSLKDIWLRGKIDSVEYVKVLSEMGEAEKQKEGWVSKFIGLSRDVDSLRDRKPEPIYVRAYTLDTLFHLPGLGFVSDGEDSTMVRFTADLKTKISFIPDAQTFQIKNISLSPIDVYFQRKQNTISDVPPLPFSLDVMMGTGKSLAGGFGFNVDTWGIGMICEFDNRPIYYIKKQFIF